MRLVPDIAGGLLTVGGNLFFRRAVWPTWRGMRCPRPRPSLEDRLTQWGATVIVSGALTVASGC